jgi:hypothetical protein
MAGMNFDELWSDKFSGTAWTSTSANENATAASAITAASIIEAMEKIRGMLPPEPTEEQRKWARDNGFPGWPGFKLGWRAMEHLKARIASPVALPQTAAPMLGVPIVVDYRLPADAVQSAEREYWLELMAN